MIFDSIDLFILALYMGICYYHVFHSKKPSALLIAVVTLTFVEITSIVFKPVRWGGPPELAKHVWYLGYMVIDTLAIALMARLSKVFSLTFRQNYELIMTLGVLLLLFTVQAARYFDRMIIESNILTGFYQTAIPAINIATLAMIIYFTVKHFYSRRKIQGAKS
ncbi:hypothetical protein [Pseudoalteromonas sp. S16_S37]|uniref:hypothetical protein n=1 Tax=Pseudoalteromonas sp. S16_S37 TaxID=2720228 RepID=UPI001EEEB7DC|nr:hypothetical protein [Pseudoalteromonas sp. S16_S37]